LSVENLSVSYGAGFAAVRDVSFSMDGADVHVILGSNGAGKTSVLRGISGFWRSETGRVVSGRVRFAGEDITGKSPRVTAGQGLVLVPEDNKIFTQLSVRDNLRAIPRIGTRHSRTENLATVLDLFPILGERGSQAAGYLSGGERQMLSIARALLLRPRLLVIDEASLGLSPIATAAVFEGLAKAVTVFRASLLLVEQNVGAALDIAERVHLMEAGRMVFSGTAQDLVDSKQIREAYLGIGEGIALN
jgi:branched-chain amino acid transport system ATP-binding protein